jgi:hypothetical protein
MKIRWAAFPSARVAMRFWIVAALLLVAGIRWGFTAEGQGVLDDLVDIHGNVINEEGDPVLQLPVRCQDSQQETVREVLTQANGEFALLRLPSRVGTIDCEVGGDRLYQKVQKKIPVKPDTQVALMLNFQTIEELQGWIAVPQGWGIKNALVQVTRKDVTFSRRTDANGQVTFKNLKAGPATVTYSADGVQPVNMRPVSIIEGSDLSASLRFDWFPFGLLLLIPAVVVLGLRAGLDWWWKQSADEHAKDSSSILIFTCLVIWGATFFVLWFALRNKMSSNLHYFHPGLSFPLAVPVFGFLGSLLFVIDVFLKGKQDVNTSMEFVLRLVLGPYVAIMMVLLFSNTFNFVTVASNLEAQATVAFFSGFLVTLVLQSLSEKGNELLGQWRNASRYEPTEIARVLKLDMEEDLKLKKVNLKYLDQLRVLEDADLIQMAKQSDRGEGFLLSLKNQARLENLKARIGEELMNKLKDDGIKTIWDLAPLTETRIKELSEKHNIDPTVLTKFSDEAKDLLQIL